jgi:hypothetical protein
VRAASVGNSGLVYVQYSSGGDSESEMRGRPLISRTLLRVVDLLLSRDQPGEPQQNVHGETDDKVRPLSVWRSGEVCFSHPKVFYRIPDVASTLDPNRRGKLGCLKSTAFTTVCYRW